MKYQQEISKLQELAKKKQALLSEEEAASIMYHNIFDYPLTSAELIKWVVGDKVDISVTDTDLFVYKKGYFYLAGREGLVLKRTMRKRVSQRKMKIAKSAAKLLRKIPTVKAVAVTGALAMQNADEDSDIDLMVITKKKTLWTTRFLSYTLLHLFGFDIRRYGQKSEKDKLCLNMWLDETALSWPKKARNIYTAHEISQAVPIVNKKNTFDRFLEENSWIKEYWPNASKSPQKVKNDMRPSVFEMVEPLARKLQFKYMEGKVTREVVMKDRALFHPIDWSEFVLTKLKFNPSS